MGKGQPVLIKSRQKFEIKRKAACSYSQAQVNNSIEEKKVEIVLSASIESCSVLESRIF